MEMRVAALVIDKGRCLVRALLPCHSEKALSCASTSVHVLTRVAPDMKYRLNKDSVLLGIMIPTQTPLS